MFLVQSMQPLFVDVLRMKFQVENESILPGVRVGRLLLLSPFYFDSRTCIFNFLVEIFPLICPVEKVVVEFLHEKDVVLTLDIFG